MAWETRRNRSYYYQSERVNGRVVKRYLGTGELASLVAQMDAIDREKREIDRLDRQAEDERLNDIEEAIAPLDLAAELAMRTTLQEAGYHQHERGAWRKRRGKHASIDQEGTGSDGGSGESRRE